MNYKKLFYIQSFFLATLLGIIVEHDSYNIFLAIASAVVALVVVQVISRGKIKRLLFFIPLSIALCQLSVTAKRAIMEVGFKQVLKDNPTGVLFADVLYGLRHVVITISKAFGGITEALGYDRYSSVEALNARFFAILIMIVLITIHILMEKRARVETT